MDQSLLEFFHRSRRNRCRQSTCSVLNVFIHCGDIRHQSLKSSEIEPNFACFGSIFFGEGCQIFKTQLLKVSLLQTMVELGDTMAKQKKRLR